MVSARGSATTSTRAWGKAQEGGMQKHWSVLLLRHVLGQLKDVPRWLWCRGGGQLLCHQGAQKLRFGILFLKLCLLNISPTHKIYDLSSRF